MNKNWSVHTQVSGDANLVDNDSQKLVRKVFKVLDRIAIIGSTIGLALLFSAETAQGIVGGSDSPDNAIANATVNVNGASGTLIAPDLVVTNGHVANVDLPASIPPFSRTNQHDPAIWHPLIRGQVNVFIGAPNLRINTTRSNALNSPRTRFTLDDRNGGNLMSGDIIGLKSDGHYLFVDGGAIGGDLRLDRFFERWGPWQALRINKVSGSEGSVIRGGDLVTLQAADGSFIAVERLGGIANANSFTSQQSHQFTVISFEGRGPLSSDPITHGGRLGLASTTAAIGWLQAPFKVIGSAIATPGYDDIALVRLAEPVSANVATPVPMKLRLLPGEAITLNAFYRSVNMSVVGYGLVSGGTAPRIRQQALVGNARRVESHPISLYTASETGRAFTQSGDSGGSWFWDSPQGRRLVGITQQTNNNFISPLLRGGRDLEGNSKPDLHAWFSQFTTDDDCVAVNSESGLIRSRGRAVGANIVCRFGDFSSPYAVAYPNATQSVNDEDCLDLNPRNLTLLRPANPEGSGSEDWIVVDGAFRLLAVKGSWQQSYTRGAYLINYIQRTGMNKMCFTNRPNARLTYFRR